MGAGRRACDGPRLDPCPSLASSPTIASWAVSRACVGLESRWPPSLGWLLRDARSRRYGDYPTLAADDVRAALEFAGDGRQRAAGSAANVSVRLLLDECLSQRLVPLLEEAGHE